TDSYRFGKDTVWTCLTGWDRVGPSGVPRHGQLGYGGDVGYDADDLGCFTAHRFARISPAAANREISARTVTRLAAPFGAGSSPHRDRSITLPRINNLTGGSQYA
ncbi:MAG: hypothetical protein ACREYC_26075, partial [Gammaproteobacteria bacterium]